MAAPTSQNLQTLTREQERLALQEQRLRVQAVESRRRQLVLQNELSSPGLAESERDYINQRLAVLSTDEDRVAQELGRTSQRLAELKREIDDARAVQVQKSFRLVPRSSPGPSPATVIAQANNLQRAAATYERRQREREETFTRLQKQIQKAFLLIGISALAIAVIGDVLSLIDAGWIVSWALVALGSFYVRRINRINDSVQLIKTAQGQALQELRSLRQRLRPALVATGQIQLFAAAETLAIRQGARSYMMTFIRDQIISQGLELIPIIDWLPLYLGAVIKLLINQESAYRTARQALVPYRQTLELLGRLERFDLELMAAQLSIPAQVPALIRQAA